MSKISDILSLNLKGWIKARGTTQAALGHDAGVGMGVVESYCQGNTWPSDSSIDAIAEVLEISASELFKDPQLDPIAFLMAFERATNSQRTAAISALTASASGAALFSKPRRRGFRK